MLTRHGAVCEKSSLQVEHTNSEQTPAFSSGCLSPSHIHAPSPDSLFGTLACCLRVFDALDCVVGEERVSQAGVADGGCEGAAGGTPPRECTDDQRQSGRCAAADPEPGDLAARMGWMAGIRPRG